MITLTVFRPLANYTSINHVTAYMISYVATYVDSNHVYSMYVESSIRIKV